MTLAQDIRTVKYWLQGSQRRAVAHKDDSVTAIKDWARGPVPDALRATRAHDPLPSGACSTCGDATDGGYRDHLLRVLDAAGFLRVPPHIRGEGW